MIKIDDTLTPRNGLFSVVNGPITFGTYASVGALPPPNTFIPYTHVIVLTPQVMLYYTDGVSNWLPFPGALASVSNTDGTLTISPTLGNVIASLNLANVNTWSGAQTFTGGVVLGPNTVVGATAQSPTNTIGLAITPNVADGASSVAFDINNLTTLVTSGSLLFRVRNNGTSSLTLDRNGTLTVLGNITNSGNILAKAGNAIDVSTTGLLPLGTVIANQITIGGSNITAASGITINAGGASSNVLVQAQAQVQMWIAGTDRWAFTSTDLSPASDNVQGLGRTSLRVSNIYGLIYNTGNALAAGSTGLQFNPNVLDGASSVAFDINAQTTLATAGALLFRIRNNGVNALTLDKNNTMVVTSGTVQALAFDRASGGNLSLGTTNATQITMGGAALAAGNTAIQLNPNVADSATSVAVDVNNQTTLATAGALLFRIRNNGGVLFSLDKNGTGLFGSGIDKTNNGTFSIATANAAAITMGGVNVGAGGITINAGVGQLLVQGSGALGLHISQSGAGSGSQSYLKVDMPNASGQTASTEVNGVNYNLTGTRTWATGALALQREFLVQAPTYAFAAASTISLAATAAVVGAPIAGTSATITESVPLLVNNNGIGAVSTIAASEGVLLQNSTAATSSVQQYSPMLILDGQGWSTTNTLSMDVRFAQQVTIASGAATPSGVWHLMQSINGAAYSDQLTMSTGGTLSVSTGIGTVQGASFDRGSAGSVNFGGTNSTLIGIGRTNVNLTGINIQTGSGALVLSSGVATSGTHQYFTVTTSTDTGQTASTEINAVNFNLSATRTWSAGAITTQREFYIQAPTYAFASASTITDAATVDISGAPIAGTNATLTNAWALRVEAGNIGIPANAILQAIAQAATNTIGTTINSNVADGASSKAFLLNNSTSLNTAGSALLLIQNNGNTKFSFDNAGKITFPAVGNSIDNHTNQMTLTGSTTTSGNAQVAVFSSGARSVGGCAALMAANSNASTGQLYIAMTSGTNSVYCYGENLTCSGTVTAGQVVVWSGTNQVSAAAQTANLTTIAGVAVTGGTNAVIQVARKGRCLVNADAGITAGQMVGTSSAVAGNCQSGTTPGVGAFLGRATEATAGTVAGQVIVDLVLG